MQHMFSYNVYKDKQLRVVFGLSFLILTFGFVLVFLKLGGVDGGLVIHFDAYKRTIDFTGGRLEIFGMLISVLAAVSMNAFLADFVYSRERFLSHLLGFVSLALTVLILIVISVIISVN